VRNLLVVVAFAALGCKAARLELEAAPPGEDAAAVIQQARARAEKDGRSLLVYVGARWCEPCQRFHQAAARGQLVGGMGRLRLLEFDLDRDRARLARAGYRPRMIPLFALPAADDRAAGRQIEGSIKGEGAVVQITHRLEALAQP
jgi:Thioredoxin-like